MPNPDPWINQNNSNKNEEHMMVTKTMTNKFENHLLSNILNYFFHNYLICLYIFQVRYKYKNIFGPSHDLLGMVNNM